MLGGVANPDGNKFCCSTSVQALPKLLPDFADWFVRKKVCVACPAPAEYCTMDTQVEDDDTAKDSLINTVEGLLADLVARGLADATVQLRPTFTASTPLELQTLLAKHCVSRPEAGKGEEMQGVFVIEAVEQSGIAMNDFLTTGSLTPMWVTLPEVVTQQLAGKVGWGIRAKAVQGDDYNEYNQSCDTWKLVEVHQVYPE